MAPHDRRGESANRRRPRHVDELELGAATNRGDRPTDLVPTCAVAAADHDGSSHPTEIPGDLLADTGACTGDNADLAAEVGERARHLRPPPGPHRVRDRLARGMPPRRRPPTHA